jgi:TolB-like protein/DNA-binding winged helix-turn-helix (wHTH) protein/Flp pilus assembly protein TadD
MSGAATHFGVGDLEVDVGLQRVLRGSVEIPLPKLSFDLFLVLIRAAPNLVSNKDLLARVWPGLVVTDKTVGQRVKLLRDALGDDPEAPRYVASLRGRGYRIVAPVRPLAPATQAVHDAQSDLVMSAKPSLRAQRRKFAFAGMLATAAFVVAALWWWLATRPASLQQEAPPASAHVPTLAVLPFAERSDNGAAGFVGIGIAEAVLARLSNVPGLDTISPDSSFQPSNEALPKGEVAKRLGADYLLDGAVERSSGRLRVSAQLTNPATGAELWAGAFDRPVAEIFDVQEDIARQAGAALAASTSSGDVSEAQPRSTMNVDAYLAYLRGRALLARWTIVAAEQAQAEFAEAINRDPNFAAAYASLYEARLLAADRAGGGGTPDAADTFLGESPVAVARAQNQHLIDRAIALDPRSGAAYFARAIWAESNSAAREQDFLRGLELDPSNGRGITAYSEYLDRYGRRDEAERMLDRALAIDPISPRALFRRVMRTFPVDPSVRMASMKQVLEIDPNYQPALQRYGKYRWMFDGDLATGITTIERALALDPGNPWLTHTLVAMYLDVGDVATARELVAEAERPEIAGDLLLALYDGDLAMAGAAAFEDAAFAPGNYENWGVYEAMRDWALESHGAQRALDSLRSRTGLVNEPRTVRLSNFRAAPAVAQLLLELGHGDDARRLLTQTIQWIDDVHLPNFSTVYALRIKASALMLLGENELALDALDASFRSNDYLQWWYTLERDPIWSPLRNDDRFRDIVARVRAHAEEQQAALVTLRQQGLVPSRAHAIN